ncbi:MAG: glycosyltransferase family 2 protein, partial [Bacteroidales bacterium]|nr:glycosyltransferase family 2 protein [Bacteroidales bacterium]
KRVLYYTHYIANRCLTTLSNIFTGLNLSDMETCYKAFKSELLEHINLKENRFGIEPEITAKLSRIKGVRFVEVGISYFGRTYSEGKKIKFRDAIRTLYCIFKYNIWSRK